MKLTLPKFGVPPGLRRGRAVVAALAVVAAVTTAVAVPAFSAPGRPGAASGRGTVASRVVGGFGSAGTVRGTFVPERSIVKHGQTYLQGELTATLRRGTGKLVGHAVRRNLNVPIRGTGAHASPATSGAAKQTCNILHLVLGPLNLNLLGLKVHLNRVVLNITAHSGSGNLLGNLLCAVAHLLDNTGTPLSLLRLENALNRVIGLLG